MSAGFLRKAMAVNLLAPEGGVDGLPREFVGAAVGTFIEAIDDRAARFAPFAQYIFAVNYMRDGFLPQ